jgi:hypothetical protein
MTPRLPGASEQPPASQLFVDLLVWNRTARLFVSLAPRKCLQDVQVVLHFVEGAVVREASQQGADHSFGLVQNCLQWEVVFALEIQTSIIVSWPHWN